MVRECGRSSGYQEDTVKALLQDGARARRSCARSDSYQGTGVNLSTIRRDFGLMSMALENLSSWFGITLRYKSYLMD
jgi:hypothetical protein